MNRVSHSTALYQYGQQGQVVASISEQVDFLGYDRNLWSTHSLIVVVSFGCTQPAADVSLDFIDPQTTLPISTLRKRVLYNDDGDVTSLVSDNLGRGWLVPPRIGGGGPMSLLFQATGQSDLEASYLLVERWWECKVEDCCP